MGLDGNQVDSLELRSVGCVTNPYTVVWICTYYYIVQDQCRY